MLANSDDFELREGGRQTMHNCYWILAIIAAATALESKLLYFIPGTGNLTLEDVILHDVANIPQCITVTTDLTKTK